MPQPTLVTIDYAGATIKSFLETLRGAGVELLIDVRDAPVLRKPDFSKSNFARHLDNAGIA